MEIGFVAAFIAGILTFFATCLIPVLPAYIGYLGGSSVQAGDQRLIPFYRRHIFINSLLFSAGFLLVFFALGLAATEVGNVLSVQRPLLAKVGGIFLILMGIYILEVIRLPILFKSFQFKPSTKLRSTRLGAFLFGLSFGFAWTPCIGPVLATIIFFASQSSSQAFGTTLLLVFGLGLAIPFILIGVLFQSIQHRLARLGKISSAIRIISGLIIIAAGFLFLSGQLGLIPHWILEMGLSPAFNYQG